MGDIVRRVRGRALWRGWRAPDERAVEVLAVRSFRRDVNSIGDAESRAAAQTPIPTASGLVCTNLTCEPAPANKAQNETRRPNFGTCKAGPERSSDSSLEPRKNDYQ